MNDPLLYIDNEKELNSLKEEWQTKLLLRDWVIEAHLTRVLDMPESGCAGYSDVQYINRCGVIDILRKEDLPSGIMKQPMEETLIHELLHFKFMTFDNNSLEGCYWNEKQHQLLEDMAKALYMTKYGLTPEWFVNG